MKLSYLIPLLLSSSLYAAPPEPPRVLIPCTVVSIHDGDTLVVMVNFPWDVTLRNQTVRCQGMDAWEISRVRQTVRITDAELAKGKVARDALATLLAGSEAVYLAPAKTRDPYGRLAAYLVCWDEGNLIEVADWMRDHGHLRTGE